jgi:hypothetical protein
VQLLLLMLVWASGFCAAASGAVLAPPCGTATFTTVEAVDHSVANSIYGGELLGGEVVADARHVSGSAALLRAVASHNSAAALNAVRAIVYHSRWHIVRLRVLDIPGRVLADFGGPYVLAPVTGVLRLGQRVVGSYVMSVQDDVGFAKLESRFVGDPIGIYYGGKLVAELGARFPAAAPSAPSMERGGVTYTVLTVTYNAFPTGKLTAVILVPPPSPALATQPCIAVRAAAIGRVAEHFAALFRPLAARYPAFVVNVHSYTGATVIVRIGLRALPGSEGLGPPMIPNSGIVAYLGRMWWVFSLAPTPPARIYLLIPLPAAPAGG